MKSKTTLICAVVLVLALAYIVLKNTDLFKPKEAPPAVSKMLLDMPKGDKHLRELAHVEISRAGGDTIALDRVAADKWRLVKPLAAAADGLKAKDLCDSIKVLEYVQALEPDDADASDQLTSLNKPQWTVNVGDAAGVTRKLLIGKNPPLSPGQTYVRVEGDKHVYIVAGDLASMVNKSPADLRDKNVLIARADEVQKVDIEGNEQYTIARAKTGAAGGDSWTISQPGSRLGMAADGPKVMDLLRRLDPLTALDFVADAPATLERYGLDKPRLIVSVWTGAAVGSAGALPASSPASAPGQGQDGPATHGQDPHATTAAASGPALTRVSLAIGTGTTEKVYAKLLDEPAVFQLEASLLTSLAPKISDLRDKQLLHFDTEQVTGIDIQDLHGENSDGQRRVLHNPDWLMLERKAGQWHMMDPVEGKANQAMVAATLEALKNLKAQSFEDQSLPERFGLDKPQVRITLLLDKNAHVTLEMGKASASGEMTFVQFAHTGDGVEHGAGVAVVKTADIKPLLEAPASYWDATIWTKPAGDRISQITLSRPDGVVELRDDGKQWSMVKPLAVPANKDSVNKLLDFLEDATATKIVSLGADVPVKRLTGAKEFITVTVTAGQRAGSVSDGASQPSTSPSATTGPASRSATGPASQPATAPAQKVHVLKLAKVDGKAYVWLEGVAVRALGEIPSSTYDDFAADFRGLDIWTIDPADVQSIKITSAKPSGPQTGTLELVKGQQEWQYPADQFVKVDAAKVKGFLESIKQVQAQRFMPQSDYWLLGTWASHSQPATKPATSTQPADYGLATPETVLELGCKDGAKVLTISKKGPDSNGRYASASDIGGVFVVADELVSKVSKNLDDFKK